MRKTKKAFRIITNKYVIAVSAFALQMLFFDDNNLFVQLDHKHQLNDLLTNKKYYEEQIKTTNQELTRLESTPASIEKFVRENFIMKRDNEDVFIIDNSSLDTSGKK